MKNLQIIADAFNWRVEKINNIYIIFDDKDNIIRSVDCLYAVSKLLYRKVKEIHERSKNEIQSVC